jgi:RHS repeat-associated protein
VQTTTPAPFATAPEEGDGSSLAPPAITLPRGGGAIRGIGEKFATNPVTGTATLRVPIAAGPGRAGFGPRLELTYDSGAGNGPFGFGWRLSLGAVSRQTDRGLPRYADGAESDVFVLSDAEDLVPALTERDGRWERVVAPRDLGGEAYDVWGFRPRVEGPFVRIERWDRRRDGDTHWRTIDRDNTTTLYGTDASSRVADPDDPARVFSWLICERYDDKGNALVYEYQAEDGAGVDRTLLHERNRSRAAGRYPKRIKYGNRTSRLVEPDLAHAAWLFEVVFDYDEGHYEVLEPDPALPAEAQHSYVRAAAAASRPWSVRPDPFSSRRAGFEVRTYRRCRRVLMFHRFDELGAEPCLVRSTEFDYADLDYTQSQQVEAELAHQGSTRSASFIRRMTQSGYVRDPARAVLERDGVAYATYLKRSVPPLALTYSKAVIQDDVRELDPQSLGNLPTGLNGAGQRWADLDGEGLSGILTEHPGGGWYYKRNLGAAPPAPGDGAGVARFAPLEAVAALPSTAGGRRQHLLDLAGDGRLDRVALDGPAPGFSERTEDGHWAPFVPFAAAAVIDWSDPRLRFVDLTGDGHADLLIAGDGLYCWHPSLGEAGFGPATRLPRAMDEERGPRLVFAAGPECVFLGDMSGDGLVDLVRVRNGEVCYWPNLGYGRFGPSVSMDNAPWLDSPDRFDHGRLCLADLDGSGTCDLVYFGPEGADLYFNQSGNRWSGPRRLPQMPVPVGDRLASVAAVDLLGTGTACLVWSSAAPGDARRPLRYLDLFGSQKPHLLIASENNLGAETRLSYAPSTRFYLADRLAGAPWITRIPFPVHVVERVERFDRVSGNHHVSRYTYHHGHFDGHEREFRGFGLVEQEDTESFAGLSASGSFPAGTNESPASHVPPVRIRTWFHTGAYRNRSRLADQTGGGGYYREPGLSDAQVAALRLEDSLPPEGLTAEEEREACRALKGTMLRQEVYALDGTAREPHPYSVTEQSFTVRREQPLAGGRHAVFFTHPRETLRLDYERDPTDPRTRHTATLAVDAFGNVLRAAALVYGRRTPDASLPAADQAEQARTFATFTEHSYTNAVEQEDGYRAPLPSETRTYEVSGLRPVGAAGRLGFDALAGVLERATEIPNHQPPAPPPDGPQPQKRLIERRLTRYRPDNLGAGAGGPLALLPAGTLESLALTGESYRLAFTPGLAEALFGERVTAPVLGADGGYVDAAGDGGWWRPSGRLFYSPRDGDAPLDELATARAHFFTPRRFCDPFGSQSAVTADAYDLLAVQTRDALGNTVAAVNDYRTLRPRLVTDPNGNRSAAAFDALGLVAGTAVMGKPGEGLGDTLEGFVPDLVEADLRAHLDDPLADPQAVLQGATSRLAYDLDAYARSRATARPQGPVVYTLTRETHQSDLPPGTATRVRHAFVYSDGFGREIQQKLQAVPGPLSEGGDDHAPRWVGSGWTVFDNKGQAVRRFEPFFTATHRFEFDVRRGVSPILCYDPLQRVVATLHPNHTWQKVVFGAWRQETWDANDTVLVEDPAGDADVGGSFARLPSSDYLPTWYARRAGGALGPHEGAAAAGAAVHAATPAVAYLDGLGRVFLTVAHNARRDSDAPAGAPPETTFQRTRVVLDVQGNQREVVDALERAVMRYDYDLLGTRVHSAGMDAGERWILNDVAGSPVRSWDSRGHAVRVEYDALRRPVATRVRGEDATRSDPRLVGREVQVTKIEYGEGVTGGRGRNLRARMYRLHDGAGTLTSEAYDFKGNLLRGARRLARDYKGLPDWAGEVPLEDGAFASSATYDALDRPVTATSPDGSVIRRTYDESGLLERVDANVRGETRDGAPLWTPLVAGIAYDARGRRRRIDYGNGAGTRYTYDPLTFRLAGLLTRRPAAAFPGDCPSAPPAGWPGCAVQNLTFTYDPVGNPTRIEDGAQQAVYFRNRRVEPSNDYVYDATYQLIEATGREHLGQTGGPPLAPDAFDAFRTNLAHPGDGQAMGTYRERYAYDPAGNILRLTHLTGGGAWTRDYVYAEPGLLDGGAVSNRLTATRTGAGPDEPYAYDVHGSMTRMPHLPLLAWDALDRLRASSRQVVDDGTPETTYYVYDGAGRRVRKVTERRAAAGATPTRKDERIYLDSCEVSRAYAGDGATISLERESLHATDGAQRVALVETRTRGSDPAPERLIRFQLGNHLGSATLELDETAAVISYEEYYPYGSTSYQATRSQTETPKRYRYTAMERDEETGLTLHGARYYAPWLGRWTSADPRELIDGPNLYRACRNAPATYVDPSGENPVLVVVFVLAMSWGVSNDQGVRDPGTDAATRAAILDLARQEEAAGTPAGMLHEVAGDASITFGRGGEIAPTNPIGTSNLYNSMWNEMRFSEHALRNPKFYDHLYYHELTHAHFDQMASRGDEQFDRMLAEATAYYQDAPLEQGAPGQRTTANDPERLVQEAAAMYVQHRVATRNMAHDLLSELLKPAEEGEEIAVEDLQRTIDSARTRYNRDMEREAFGYEFEGLVFGDQIETTKPIHPGLRAYLDGVVLEGRIEDDFDADAELPGLVEQIRTRAGW